MALPEAPPAPCSQPQPARTGWNRLQSPHRGTNTWLQAPSAGQGTQPTASTAAFWPSQQSMGAAPVEAGLPMCPPCPPHADVFYVFQGWSCKGHPLLFSAFSTAQTHKEVLSLIPVLVLRAAEGRWCTYMLLLVTAFFFPKHRPWKEIKNLSKGNIKIAEPVLQPLPGLLNH